MFSDVTIIIMTIIGVIIIFTIEGGRTGLPMDYPPNPPKWPIIRNLYHFGKDPYTNVLRMAKKYGPTMSFDWGDGFKERVIFVNEPKHIKEFLNNDGIQGRPTTETWENKYREIRSPYYGGPGIIHAIKDVHKDNRALLVKELEDYTANRMEAIILREVKKIHEYFEISENQGLTLSVENLFEPLVAIIVWELLAHRRMPINEKLCDVTKIIDGLFGAKKFRETPGRGSEHSTPFMLFPSLRKMMPTWSGWRGLFENYEKLNKYIYDIFQDHKTFRDYPPSAKDFIDRYQESIAKCFDNESIYFQKYGDLNLYSIVGDVVKGVDLISVTLQWALAIVIPWYHDSKLMTNIRAELDAVVKKPNQVTLKDRENLPLMHAFVKEVLRFRPALPFGFAHKATEYTKIGKFNVPQGTHVIPNLFGCFHDEEIFPDPEEFKPERFLSEDGKELLKLDAFIPFGAGKRMCPGGKLTEDTVFLFLANIFKYFIVFPSCGPTIPPLTPMPHFICKPKPYEFTLVKRFRYDP